MNRASLPQNGHGFSSVIFLHILSVSLKFLPKRPQQSKLESHHVHTLEKIRVADASDFSPVEFQ